jgi:hypothetical protein
MQNLQALKPTTVRRSTAGDADEHPERPRVAGRVILLLLRAYKLLVSPLFAGSCRFEPSCSAYMAEAVIAHGALGGVWLGIKRLARCQPFCTGGYDPVPLRLTSNRERRRPEDGPLRVSASRWPDPVTRRLAPPRLGGRAESSGLATSPEIP